MLSLDRGLLGNGMGDVVERHREYAGFCARLSIVVITPPGYQHALLSPNLDVYPTNGTSVYAHARAIFGFFKSIQSHARVHCIIAQDLLAPFAYALSLWYHVPFIVSVHGVWWDQWYARKHFWNRWYAHVLLYFFRNADAVRVVSEGLKHALLLRKVRANKIHVIPTPVRIQRFERKDDPGGEAPLDPGEPLVISVGRLEAEKGFDVLLLAWKEVVQSLKNVRLIIVGDGSARKKLNQMVLDFGLNEYVHFVGVIPSQELPHYYHRASVFALASESESFGKVFVESAAAGLPSVATATLGAQSVIIDAATGYLVPVGDHKAMSEKLILLLNQPDHARAMGKEALLHVQESFGWEKNIKRMAYLWHRTSR